MGTRKLIAIAVVMLVTAPVSMTSALQAAAEIPTPPILGTQPDMALVTESGKPASFTVGASGWPTPTVQWQESTQRSGQPWTDIPGATGLTLDVTSSYANLGHAYRAVLTNPNGTVTSRPAKLVSRTDWMRDLGSDIADVPITQLAIPGTHDTGTYDLHAFVNSKDHQTITCEHGPAVPICPPFAMAQDKSITDELNDGIRYFDLRVCGNGDLPDSPEPPDFVAISSNPVTCHQFVSAAVADILRQTRSWVDSHPTEVVYLDFNHEYQVDLDTLAGQIEDAFKLDPNGDHSLLIPPEYCNETDATSGTCAGNLTLGKIRSRGLGNVIVNFMNDGVPGDMRCFPGDGDPNFDYCGTQYRAQHGTMPSFYYIHWRLWGLTFSGLTNMATCTVGGAEATCFGNDSDIGTVLPRVQGSTTNRQTFAEPHPADKFQHFFVQFLQTTPDGGYIGGHYDDSLFKMAKRSNPIIGPAFFGCPSQWSSVNCFAPTRPENVNIVAVNFYDLVDYTGWGGDATFDFVREVLSFNEYSRTAPVVSLGTAAKPASTGWYNAASVGGPGQKLKLNVSATDYRYNTGINALDCSDYRGNAIPVADGYSTGAQQGGNIYLGDGGYVIDCTAEDGASLGTLGRGNRGGGPGSTLFPRTYLVDTTPPQISCPANAGYVLNQPVSSMNGMVTDDGSGVASGTASGSISTAQVGTFHTTVNASDVAGNTASATCSYTVSYAVGLRYDTTKQNNSGSTVPIKLELDDYYGVNVSGPSIAATATSVTDGRGNNTTPNTPGNGNNQKFQLTGLGYQYDLKTSDYTSGSYSLDFLAGGDPVTHHAPFQIR